MVSIIEEKEMFEIMDNYLSKEKNNGS